MGLSLAEARYQACKFSGDVKFLEEDFKLRYGDMAEHYLELVGDCLSLSDEERRREVERILAEYSESLAKSVEERLRPVEELAVVYSKYVRFEVVDRVVRAMFSVMGMEGGLEELISRGFLMHFADNVVVVPEYAIRLMLKYASAEYTRIKSLDQMLEEVKQDGATLATLEVEVFGYSVDEEVFRRFYEVDYVELRRRLRISHLVIYVEEVDRLVFTPLYSVEEISESLVDLKDREAKRMSKLMRLPGEYEYNRSVNCGVQYTSFDTSREGSALILFCPWFTPHLKLLKYHRNEPRVFVVKHYPTPELVEFLSSRLALRYTGFVLMPDESNLHVVRPERPVRAFENLVDLFYRYGFNVTEY